MEIEARHVCEQRKAERWNAEKTECYEIDLC